MEKEAIHHLGTNTYETTKLEDFLDEMATSIESPFSHLKPMNSVTYGPHLAKHTRSDDMSMVYYRNVSESEIEGFERFHGKPDAAKNIADILYSADTPISETAQIYKDGTKIEIKFEIDGTKTVDIYEDGTSPKPTIGLKVNRDSQDKEDFIFNFVTNYLRTSQE